MQGNESLFMYKLRGALPSRDILACEVSIFAANYSAEEP